MRGRFERHIRSVQDTVCAAVAEVDGASFRQDAWTRVGGGGGITRVIQEGNVWEKAGVAVSVVYGSMPADAYRTAIGKNIPFEKVRCGRCRRRAAGGHTWRRCCGGGDTRGTRVRASWRSVRSDVCFLNAGHRCTSTPLASLVPSSPRPAAPRLAGCRTTASLSLPRASAQ